MFERKSHRSLFPAAVAAALAVTVTVAMAALVEAVTGMQSFF